MPGKVNTNGSTSQPQSQSSSSSGSSGASSSSGSSTGADDPFGLNRYIKSTSDPWSAYNMTASTNTTSTAYQR
ncbi:hypothetical protein FQN49_005348 [Arthroderma sp. PD_2]|nr:hypothetical protein FQN49_005348 [Arthroderma sp. PD_2]